MVRTSLWPLLVLVGMGLPARAVAQPERYEFGRRLGYFERAWDKPTPESARKKALAHVEAVTLLLLAGHYGEAGKALDRARWALAEDKGFSLQVAWAESLSWAPLKRVLDAGATDLPFVLKEFYDSKAAAPGATLRIIVLTALASKAVELPVGPLPWAGKLPLVGVPPGDHLVSVQVMVDKKVVGLHVVGVSLVKDLPDRLAMLKKAVAGFGKGQATVEQLTLHETLASVEALAAGETREADYPAARMLKEAEGVVEALAASKKYYSAEKTGQFRLRVPAGKNSTALRLLVPDSAKDGKALPLVVALHGLGGSENVCFEAYGAGLTVKLCQERGWLLAAPRNASPAGVLDLVDELSRIYPVDRSSVFLIGHSIGGRHAVTAAEQSPGLFAAVAALGSGGAVPAKKAPVLVPFFIGVGTKDLAHGLAKGLRNQLTKAGVKTVEYHEYPDIEHLLVVRAALPDVFALFDKVAKTKG
jgi:predicted esterase